MAAGASLQTSSAWSAAEPSRIVPRTMVQLQLGSEYVLQPRFVDVNTAKIVCQLEADSAATVAGSPPPFVSLLRETVAYGVRAPAPPAPPLEPAVASAFRMTMSQTRIYQHVCEHSLTLVCGPPGSGKTHFLGATIGRLIAASRRARRPLRILVTAFTHDALNHVLAKAASMMRAAATTVAGGETPPVFKYSFSSGSVEAGCRVRAKARRGLDTAKQYRVASVDDDGAGLQVQRLGEEGEAESVCEQMRADDVVRLHAYETVYGAQLKRLGALEQCVVGTTTYQVPPI